MSNQKSAQEQDLLSSLQIAAPCNVSWDSMTGGDRIRHCEQCTKNVYNISDMTKHEANEFLQATAFKACVTFYQRSDGTILVDNCPVGLRKIRAQYRKIAAAAGTIISLASGVLIGVFAGDQVATKHAKSPDTRTLGRYSSNNSLRGEPAAIPNRLGGEPTALGGKPMAGAPAPIIDSASIKNYRAETILHLSAVMPKTDLGHAALSFNVDRNGSITQLKVVNPSPSKKTDERIIKSVSNLKLPALPADYGQPALTIYYECQQRSK